MVITTCGVVAVLASSCGSRERANTTPQQGSAGATSIITNPQVVYRDRGGNVLWSARARRSIARQDTSAVELEGVSATIYDSGRPAWTCRADWLRAEEPSSQVVFSGGVRIESADGQSKLAAPHVVWAIREGQIRGDGGVRVRVGKLVVNGSRFEVSTRDGTWRVVGGSTAAFEP
ncbi:MAG: LPS export ABC transporter periplasmic protein LptC [Armatimonadota bacterium]